MGEPFETLMQVQAHDTTLDRLRHQMDSLSERSELLDLERRRAALRATTVELQGMVEDLARRQRELEEQIAATAGRRHGIEARMRSGEGFAPRDLEAMDQEVRHLAARQSMLEEEEIALLEEEEPLDADLVRHETAVAAADVDAARLEAVIVEATGGIRATIDVEQARRAEAASGLPGELAERYERLRSHLGGVGAARLVGDRCDGCHLTLPSAEVERVRHLPADELATCTQCDRILVH